MSAAAPALPAPPARPPRAGRTRLALGARLPAGVLALTLALGIAAAVTYAPIPRLALVLAAAGLVAGLAVLASGIVAAALLGLSIPVLQDVTGGHLGGLHVAPSDLLLVLVGIRALADASARGRGAALRALRPAGPALVQYAWAIAVLLVVHLSLASTLKSAQRLELFALPAVVGAYAALHRRHLTVLRGYVAAATALAVAWPALNPTGVLGSQFDKNPVGGFIAGAILVLLGVRELRRWRWCLPILVAGLALSASRGAILGLIVGMVAIAMMHRGGSRRAAVAGILVVLACAFATFQFLPSSATARLTTLSSSSDSSGGWAIYYRDRYYHDAELLIARHPWTGVGVGNYATGSVRDGTYATDPHDVILLTAAEGGYLFAASFLALVLGTGLALWRMRRSALAPAAAGVLVATFVHGLVDVYWVRGTPVLGWLLVGMVCGLAASRPTPAEAS